MNSGRFITLAYLGAAALVGTALSGESASAGEPQVTICHVPPGNPANAHRITVGESAVSAHLAHGDLVLGTGSSFTFYSGAATATPGSGGQAPITSGVGATGGSDPITKIGMAPAMIIDQNPAWSLIPGTKWISYADTTIGGGTPNGTTVDFDVLFNVPNYPACHISPSVTVSALGDDAVTVFLNGTVIPPSPLASYTTVGTTATSSGILPGQNLLRLAVTQLGGDGFGLDYRVTVTLD